MFHDRVQVGLTSSFRDTLDSELPHKIFSSEADRGVVRNIVFDFLTQRNLVDAIRRQDGNAVRTVVCAIPQSRRRILLDQSIDSLLNTPLHLAVMYGCPDIAEFLIEHGSSPSLRNLRGDTPHQLWAFPRISRAAQVHAHRPGQPDQQDQHDVSIIGCAIPADEDDQEDQRTI